MLTEEHEGLVVPSGYRIHALVQMSFEVRDVVLAFSLKKVILKKMLLIRIEGTIQI